MLSRWFGRRPTCADRAPTSQNMDGKSLWHPGYLENGHGQNAGQALSSRPSGLQATRSRCEHFICFPRVKNMLKQSYFEIASV